MKAQEVTAVAVVGAGTMGSGVAGVFARAGYEVRLVEKTDDLLHRGMGMLRGAQEALVNAKLLTRRRAAAALKRVTPLTALEEACDGVQLLVESVPEDLSLKQEVFARFDRFCPRRAVLASNTSGLSISKMAAATERRTRVAGMHFFNPPHIMPLVEVTKGKDTSDSTARMLMDVARRIGKRPILVRQEVPGFVANRLQFAVMREAFHLLAAGVASAEDIDTAMTAGPGFRYCLLGPLRTADLAGLDVFHAISSYLFAELDSRSTPPKILADLVKKGKLGAKSGAGFYKYSGRKRQEILRRRDQVLLELLKTLREDAR